MNVFKTIYCRTFQLFCRAAIPFLPYREPVKLNDYAEIADVMSRNNLSRALVVTDKTLRNLGVCDDLLHSLDGKAVGYVVYDKTVANPTTDNVAEATQLYLSEGCDCLIAIGGGSSMDCAKAVGAQLVRPNKTLGQLKGLMKVRRKLPLLFAIPTTAGTGSETTVAAVITDGATRRKYAINDFCLIPNYVLLDTNLTVGLPPYVTATTGMDALTHAIEAYVGRSTTRDSKTNALNAAKLIFHNLPLAYAEGGNIEARANMLYASYAAGLAFTKSYVGYVHAIAHALGGKYNVAHGLANAVILPVVLDAYGKSAHKKLWKIGVFTGLFDSSVSKSEGARRVVEQIRRLNEQMSIPSALDCIVDADVETLAAHAEAEGNPLYPVPKLFTAKQLAEIIRKVGGISAS